MVAKAFGVQRSTVYDWVKDEDYKQVLDDSRGELLDIAIVSAKILARGIPEVVDGKQVGWITPPDPGTVKYLLGTLGRREGFGESIDVTTNGKDINGLFRVLTKEEIESFNKQFDKDY